MKSLLRFMSTNTTAKFIVEGIVMKKTRAALRFKAFWSIILFMAGLVGIFQFFLIKFKWFGMFADLDAQLSDILSLASLELGALATVLGFIAIVVCSAKLTKIEKQIKDAKADAKRKANAPKNLDGNKQDDAVPVMPIEQLTASNGGPIVYVPALAAPEFVNMGDKQPVDEKFAQIARMDKTQFVVYVARLFSRKGYAVKLSPVVDNYCVDMLVEKQGVVTAVGVTLTTSLLSKKDIECVREGRRHYPANNVMVLTNSYFEVAAVDYAKEQGVALVDHNILASQFMA